jgi:hypothetical protein
MLYRTKEDIKEALEYGSVISIHHKPDAKKGGHIMEGMPSDFVQLVVSEGEVSFSHLGVPHKFPITEVASVGTY